MPDMCWVPGYGSGKISTHKCLLRTECSPPPSSYIEILTLDRTVLGGGAFEVIRSWGWRSHEWG